MSRGRARDAFIGTSTRVRSSVASTALVYRALRAQVKAWRSDPTGVALRFFIDGATIARLGPWLPREPTLSSYLTRLRQQLGGKRFLLVANDLQRFDSSLRERVSPLRDRRPGAALEAGLFLGDYPTTAFGVHRDKVDVWMWMLRGRKVMRLWPSRALSAADLERYGGDYRAFVHRAKSITLQRGDFLSWRAGVWHVGESKGLSASLNVAFRTRGGTFAHPE